MKRFIPLLLVLLLTLVLAIVIEDFVRLVIVEPLLLILWFAGTLFRNLPHVIFWAVFVLMASIVLLKSLQVKGPLLQQRRRTDVIPSRGHVASWQHQLQRADWQPYYRWELARSLAKLSQRLLTTTDSHNPPDSQATLALVEALPPEIAAYFLSSAPHQSVVRAPWYRWQTEEMDPVLALDPEVVVDYLEKEMGRD